MLDSAKIFVAGHRGLVGSAIVRALKAREAQVEVRTRAELDLTDPTAVDQHFEVMRPDVVFIAAARVGGIAANIAAPVEFLVENLAIQNNLLLACQRHEVMRTVFLGSSCIYPRDAPQPMSESSFMHGPLEPTNESYAIAKIAGIRLASALHQQYGTSIVCPMPCNVYGVGDHFDLERAHVVSALVRRFVEARDNGSPSVTLWGTGSAQRELLFSDDLADACLFLAEHKADPEIINVGTGVDHSIVELATLVADVVGYEGKLEWDHSKPDGMPRKVLDVTKIHDLGWRHNVELEEGLRAVVQDFETRVSRASESHA